MSDESYIQLAIELAKKGNGKVSPNPLVGCVIVKDERIIAAGYHEKYGGPHAEVNAIESAKESVENSTVYVNLEPCSHFGLTPPCADFLIEKKVKKVVIGTLDMNPLVSGKGIKKLKQAGIEVKVGVLENECANLNRFFFKYISKKMPYVTIKAAQTLDGKIADINGESKWISSLPSRRYVHTLRSYYDAVLVGAGTVLADNPSLTVRYVEGRNPKKIILDSKLSLKPDLRLLDQSETGKTIIVTSMENQKKEKKIKKFIDKGVMFLFVRENANGMLNLNETLRGLAKLNIASILVEGGSNIYSSFIKKNLFDEMLIFIAPKLLGQGLCVVEGLGINSIRKSVKLKVQQVEKVGDDILVHLNK